MPGDDFYPPDSKHFVSRASLYPPPALAREIPEESDQFRLLCTACLLSLSGWF